MSVQHNRRAGDGLVQTHQLAEELRLVEIEHNIKSLEEKIDALTENVDDLVSAWKAASWLVSIIKWVGGIAVALTAIATLIKGFK